MKDVIVVGGGPTGFVTALGLAQAGADVTLIEAGQAIIDSPRAAVYHWSTLDGLERLGIREEAERTGFTKQDYLWLVRRTGERIAYDLSVLADVTPFPYNIHLGQDRLAGIARERLGRLANAEVRFGARLDQLAQDDAGVTVTLEDGEELRARWVVGADGAGSTVRHRLALPFDGMTWPERFVATNLYYPFEDAGYGQSTMVIDDAWGAVIVRLSRDGLWRCTFMESADLPEAGLLDRLPDDYRHLLPDLQAGASYRLERAAPYKMHQRCAGAFRHGRVLLAGDAAHVTNPTGGFGLTTGLFDAFSLWPTLAAVVLEGADPARLDRWAQARRTIYLQRTSPQAIAYKQFVFHAGGSPAGLEAALEGMRAMARDPDVRRERLMFVKSLETPGLD